VCDLGEPTVHSGGDGSGELGLLVGQAASRGGGGVMLPPSEGESVFAMVGLLHSLNTGEYEIGQR